jgi:serine/threonine protein phosphatase PrpC
MQLDYGCCNVSEVSCGQQQTSYDSVILQQRLGPEDSWAAYAILDGHNGDAVAKFVSGQLLQQLVTRLPGAATYACSTHGFAEQTRKAVTAAFLATAQALHSSSTLSGAGTAAEGCSCAATLVLHTGSLLTVANVGTSSCWLDLGRTVINLTTDHRAGADDDETDRLATGEEVLLGGANAGWYSCSWLIILD